MTLGKLILKLAKTIKDNILEITILGYLLLFCAGMIAWMLNGLGVTKFDLNFIWQGISTLFGPGVFGSLKYLADSALNSERGAKPYTQLVERRNTVNDERRIGERDCERSDSDRS